MQPRRLNRELTLGLMIQNQNYKKAESQLQSQPLNYQVWMIRGRMIKVYDHIVVGAGINGSSAAYQVIMS